MDSERDEPNRFITKLEGVRHILHSAIRCHLAGEDPFAIHILAQSAERVLIDILKANGISDPFYSLIKPERRAEFLATYREPVCRFTISCVHPILRCSGQLFALCIWARDRPVTCAYL
jgi:hypothetical protein